MHEKCFKVLALCVDETQMIDGNDCFLWSFAVILTVTEWLIGRRVCAHIRPD